MESGSPPAPIGKRLMRIVRTIYYMLRKGISKSKLLMDLHLVLKRGKLAGKVLTSLLTLFHHHYHHQTTADNRHPDSKEVQFSCSNTPSYAFNYFHTTAKKRSSRHLRPADDSFDAVAMARAFEMMNADQILDAGSPAASSAFPTPSPMLMGLGRSTPMMVRKLRITDSPFPIQEDGEGADGGRIDRAADEFIKNFYEQLRFQQLASAAATPDEYNYYNDHRRRRT